MPALSQMWLLTGSRITRVATGSSSLTGGAVMPAKIIKIGNELFLASNRKADYRECLKMFGIQMVQTCLNVDWSGI